MTPVDAYSARLRRGPASLHERLGRGEALLGTFVKSPDPNVTEVLVRAGYDWLVADLDHSTLTLTDVASIIRTAELEDVPVVVRLTPSCLHLAGRALDAGAAGLQVTDVSSAETAAAAQAAAFYAPRGRRGLAFSHRAASFGLEAPESYLRRADESVALIAQIESDEGVAALPELVAGAAFDGFFLGPTDLASSLGHPEDPDHPVVLEALERAASTVLDHDKTLGVFARCADDASAWRRRGARLIACSSDVGLLARAARADVRHFSETRTSGRRQHGATGIPVAAR